MTVTSLSPLAAPFRGLAPFGDSELDALLFFGRERETEIAVANLLAARLTILYGPSGVGKSSLLRAGVARRVRELGGHRAIGRGPDGAAVVFASWADDPVRDLAEAIADEVTSLVKRPVARPVLGTPLVDVVEHWTNVLDGSLYIVLDQLEEYFVYQEAGGPGTLEHELPEVVQRPRLRANVLLSLRDDALAQLDVFKARLPNLFANYLRLDRLDRAAATAAIVGPIERWNQLVPAEQRVAIEPELVAAVLAEAAVADEPDRIEPPYLQLVLERLWNEEGERGSRVLRASTLAELGGAQAIVREHLDRALSVLDERELGAAALMFDHLVTPSGTKIAHRVSDLAQFAHVPVAEAATMLAALGRERILRPLDEGGGGGDRYEIFHDVLGAAVVDWQGRHQLSAERAQARRRQRRLLVVAAAALLALVVVSAIAIFALVQRRDAQDQARRAQAGELSAQALLGLTSDPQASLAMALEAAQLRSDQQTEDVLRSSLLTSRLRKVAHVGGRVVDVEVSPDGRDAAVVASGGRGTLIWHLGTGQLRVLDRDPGTGRVRYDGDGSMLLTAGGVATIVRDARSGLVEARLPHASDAAFVSGGRNVLTASAAGLRLWSAAGGHLVRSFPGSRFDVRLVVSPDGRRVAAIGGDGKGNLTPSLYTASGRLVRRLPQSGTRALAFSRDSKLLATAGSDGSPVVWRARDGRRVQVFDDGGKSIASVAFSPDGSMLATGSDDDGVRVWSLRGLGKLFFFTGHVGPVTSVRFDPTGASVVSTSDDGTSRIFEVAGIDAGESKAVLAGGGGAYLASSYTPSGARLVTGGTDGTARLWDTRLEQTLPVVATERGPVAAAAFTAGGRSIVQASTGSVAVLPGGRRIATYSLDRPIAFGAGLVATAGGAAVRVADASSGAARRMTDAPEAVKALALSLNGREVAAAAGDRAVVWDATTGHEIAGFTVAPGTTTIAISPTGQLVLTGGADGSVRLWSVDGKLVARLGSHPRAVTSASFAPSGETAVTTSQGPAANAIEWDIVHRRLENTLVGHAGTVAAASFSSDGRWIATAGPASAAIWNAATGARLFYLYGPRPLLSDVQWSPVGYRVVVTSRDRTVRTYTCTLCRPLRDLVPLAEARLAAAH
jgi:WD40 repeat protein